MDEILVKISTLVVIQNLITVFKDNITRWLIKTFFTNSEFPLSKWYTSKFLLSLNLPKILSLGVIASFTLITFPLGIWLASFSMNKSYPIIRMIGITAFMITFPINIYLMVNKIREMTLNTPTVLGIVTVEIGYLIALVGSWFIYLGGKTG